MLQEIRISNLALIERAEIHCGPGLNILTGETGAGKSILITALGLLMGERAEASQVGQVAVDGADNGAETNGAASKNGAKNGTKPKSSAKPNAPRALVEGAFDLKDSPRAKAFLEGQDVPIEDDLLVVTREVSVDGRSRVRLNGRLSTAATLRELGALLVDLHGQHDTQLLLDAESHLSFLDAFGDVNHQALRAQVREKYSAWTQSQRRLDELTGNEQQRAQRLDMLQFQATEIDSLAPQPDEDSSLADERSKLMNAEKLREAAAICRDALIGGDEPGALTLVTQALKAAREIQGVDASVEAWVKELEDASYALEDAASEAREYADMLDADPMRLEEIEARLHRLNRLKRKYGDSLERVLAYRAEIEGELSNLSLSDAELASLREEMEKKRREFERASGEVTKARKTLAKDFSQKVVQGLSGLAMERARFDVHFERNEKGSREGMDAVEFLLSANPGQPLRPLARIASGGEISRVMLALRSVLNDSGHAQNQAEGDVGGVPTLIFDEVDSGIGGVTAEAVGEKMQELARASQVFCVTHLPQIARRADRHYRVLKESDDERTSVSVTLLKGEERVRELARMMGRETPDTLRHARALLKK